MARNEKYFLNGIVRYLKPKKTLEVGVAHGGGTAIILNAIRDIDGARLISEDYNEKYYLGNIDKLSGYLIDEKFPQLKDKWTIYRGGDISRYIERIDGDIDLLVLDTAHIHPWETLNFLCILPFMKCGSWCVLHDIALPMFHGRENDLACRYLWGHVVSDIKVMPMSDFNSYFANIGAFRITEDTVKYVQNMFESLLAPWAALPGVFDRKSLPFYIPIQPEDLNDVRKAISKYYPEYVKLFDAALKAQQDIAKQKAREYRSFKATWKRNSPLSFALAKKLKHIVKG